MSNLFHNLRALIMTTSHINDDQPLSSNESLVAVLRLRGEIAVQTPLMTDLANVLPQIETHEHTALIVTLDTVGGSLATAQALNDWIKRLYRNHGKPVVCVIEERCLSAGIAIAVSCDQIFAPPAASIGAFGAMMSWPLATEFRSKYGLAAHNYTSTPFKDIASPNRLPTKVDEDCIMDLLEDLHEQFRSIIRDNRPQMQDAGFDRIADGRLITALRAKHIGLIDDTGGFDAALEYLTKQGAIPSAKQPDFVFLGDPKPADNNSSLGSQLISLLKGSL
ncbi:MAG: S49 family peptidase [Pseudomonadales bacterium]|nr:S49 family peptidase [Pseudomonadales bacterium]